MNHNHDWETTFQMASRIVQRCACGAVQSLVWDHDKNKRLWVPGNLWQNTKPNRVDLFIICNHGSEYTDYIQDLIRQYPHMGGLNIYPVVAITENVKIAMDENPHAPILLIGEWHENEIINNPWLTIAINTAMEE